MLAAGVCVTSQPPTRAELGSRREIGACNLYPDVNTRSSTNIARQGCTGSLIVISAPPKDVYSQSPRPCMSRRATQRAWSMHELVPLHRKVHLSHVHVRTRNTPPARVPACRYPHLPLTQYDTIHNTIHNTTLYDPHLPLHRLAADVHPHGGNQLARVG